VLGCHADLVGLKGKLQIKPGQSAVVLNSPGVLVPVEVTAVGAAEADVVIGVVVHRSDLSDVEDVLAAAREDRRAWIAYPKGGKLDTDLNRDRLVEAVSDGSVHPVRQVSIDDTWSALRFRPATG
jgi:hypothetical protein